MKHKRDLIVRSRTREGMMRIPPEDRPLLQYELSCPHCRRIIRQTIVTNLYAGDLVEAGASFSEHLCPKCGGEFTREDQQAAREHLSKLQLAQPQFSERLLNFFHAERLS